MKIQNVKGGYDYSPKEQKIRNYINSVITKNFEEFGFLPIETSILCYYDILSDKYDENNDILKEIYRLKDQGCRDLGLRYDLTVPFAKYIALNKNNITFPFKRYEIAKVFRDGPVKVGRDREFTQCDADVVGIKGQLIEAELLSLYYKTFKELGIDIIIKYNSRNLMTGLIKEADISDELVPSVTTILDKLNKVTSEELTDMLLELGLVNEQIDKLNKLFKLSLDDLNKSFINTTNEKIILGLEETNKLSEYLKVLEISDICKFDITLARGQNYYTGNVFEVYDKDLRVTGSIGAGGRYDNMIKNFIGTDEEYPTVGISFGLSSIYEILKTKFDEGSSNIDIYIIPLETEIQSIKIANELRNLNYKVEVEMSGRKLKKSLDYANRQNIKYVIIIGTNELENGILKIKDMNNNSNIEISLNSLENIVNLI